MPQCAQLVLQWQLESGKIGHNVTYGRYAGTFSGSPAQATSISTALVTGAQWTALAGFLAAQTQFLGVSIRDVNVADQPIIQPTAGTANGTSASASVPNEVALVGTLRTGSVGRANRGRMFVPGWATNALGTGNVVAAAAVTAYQNWLNTIIGIYAGQGYTLVIGQKARAQYTGSTGTVHPARPAGSTTVTQIVVRDNHWDSQRRRGLK